METTKENQNEDSIKDVDELIKELDLGTSGSSFVIFIGSAVSGVNSPNVPMVLDVIQQIFLNIYFKLGAGLYNEKIASEYAKSLISKCYYDKNKIELPEEKVVSKKYRQNHKKEGHKTNIGKHDYITNSTKFEEYLGIIELIVGREKLNELLRILYLCEDKEYGRNQSAITWLLENGFCDLCLTTNFDNSIENSSKFLKSYRHPKYPKNFKAKLPLLLKLHGDVTNNSCVSTNRSLYVQTTIKAYDFLIDLLDGKKILVLGYSGLGDVDIFPKLLNTNADFYWGVRDFNSAPPLFPKSKVICKLDSNDPNLNLLQGLARHYGWNPTFEDVKAHQWKIKLQRWCESINNEKLANIIIHTFYRKPDWSVVHLMSLFPYTLDFENAELNKARACLQKSAYGPAEKIFRKMILDNKLSEKKLISVTLFLGFTQWRKRKYKESLRTLYWFNSLDPDKYKDKHNILIEINGGLRIYLEVLRDWMQLKLRINNRKRIFSKYNGKTIVKKFEQLETYDFKDYILKRIVLLNINCLLNKNLKKSSKSEVIELFNQSFNTNNFEVATAAGRLLVYISRSEGIKHIQIVNRKLMERNQPNYRYQNLTAVISKNTQGLFPWLMVNVFLFNLLVRFAMSLRDYIYLKKIVEIRKLEKNQEIKIF